MILSRSAFCFSISLFSSKISYIFPVEILSASNLPFIFFSILTASVYGIPISNNIFIILFDPRMY